MAAARFFVDENDLALGRALAELHDGVVYPGHIDLPERHSAALWRSSATFQPSLSAKAGVRREIPIVMSERR